uniref:Uncharacterized protein n=1 Tax=Knipowitschia caucasica TaxID=637954 RepID=A0AAV2LGC8_KNICA
MLCILWLTILSLSVPVKGGLISASAEALAKAGGKNVGAAAGNNINAAAQNGVNGQAVVAHIVPFGGTFFLQQAGNQVGQPPVQQLIPLSAVQQGGQFVVGQPGQPGPGSPITLFTILPQGGGIGTPQNTVLTQGQVQLISAAGVSSQAAPGNAGGIPGGLRFVRSAATRLRRTKVSGTKAMASEEEEEEEEEEEGSGMDRKRNN